LTTPLKRFVEHACDGAPRSGSTQQESVRVRLLPGSLTRPTG